MSLVAKPEKPVAVGHRIRNSIGRNPSCWNNPRQAASPRFNRIQSRVGEVEQGRPPPPRDSGHDKALNDFT